MEYGWLIAFLFFLITELMTVGLTTIWFAVGALIAHFAFVLGAPVWLQIALFVIVSVIMMVFVRPFAVNVINNRTTKTNVEAVLGKKAKVTVTINNIEAIGMVTIDGQEWTARTEDDTIIEEGSLVEVIRIEGVKAIVRKAD